MFVKWLQKEQAPFKENWKTTASFHTKKFSAGIQDDRREETWHTGSSQ